MTKKIGDKKLGGVKSTTHATEVEGTEAVSRVTSIQATPGVSSVKGASAIGKRRTTRVMTVEEREQLLQMVEEEAEKALNAGILPQAKKEVVTQAVKMAVDASLISEDEAREEEKFEAGKKKNK